MADVVTLFGEHVREGGGGPSPEYLARFPLNDLGNAMRLILVTGGQVAADGTVESTGSRLLFLHGVGWVGFAAGCWDRETGEDLARKSAHQVANMLPGLFEHVKDRVPAKEFFKFANESGSAGKTSAMLAQAKSYLTVKIDAFDRDPMLINCRNGTLKMRWTPPADGRAGRFEARLHDHDPADRITRMAAVDYRSDAEAPLFLATVAASLPDPGERAAFHRMLGYSSTGHIHEQAFFFNQGPGQDGKSTLLDACREALGTYAIAIRPETFLEAATQGGGGPQPDLVAMAGDTRLAIVSEPKRGSKLSEGLLKGWTSGSPISARDLYGKPIQFRPLTKLVWEMNSFVVARGDDDGIWRRIKPVLFRRKVPDAEVDKLLPSKLRAAELPGVLNWLVAGVGDWLAMGLAWPDSLNRVVDDYRRASSPFGDWLSECCVWGEAAKGARELSAELMRSYREWCEAQGNDKPMSTKGFGDALRDRQVGLAGKNAKGLKYRGPIRLKTLDELADDAAASEAPRAAPATQSDPGVGGVRGSALFSGPAPRTADAFDAGSDDEEAPW